jgi:diguanylate cyclase (GGDEF)-like protein
MNMLRADLEHDRKDLEIALLEGQALLNQSQANAQHKENQLQRYLIILSVAISLVIFAGFLQQRRNNRRVLALSHSDGLTGLYNRRYTFGYLERVIPQTYVADNGPSIVLMDIDNFKAINDEHGHPMGDAVLQRVSAIGEQSLRNRDIIGRIGGEEFLCVLPRASTEQGLHVAQRLLDAISREVFSGKDGSTFSITMSIGIAHFSTDGTSAHQLYSFADTAMYHSKNTGKGRITTYQPDLGHA